MSLSRTASAALVISTALPWSVLMVVGGVWLLTLGHASGLGGAVPGGPWRSLIRVGGVFWLASGQLLFMSLVADRLFPRASRRLVTPVEIATSVTLFLCVIWALILLVSWFGMQGH